MGAERCLGCEDFPDGAWDVGLSDTAKCGVIWRLLAGKSYAEKPYVRLLPRGRNFLFFEKITERKETMKLIKRNGSEEIFDREKIAAAIMKANEAVDEDEQITKGKINKIAAHVESNCEKLGRAV